MLLLLNVVQAWLNQMTALYMREGLTRDLVNQWLQRKARASAFRPAGLIGVNPDQRLHEDARNLAESTTGLMIGLVQATILLVELHRRALGVVSGFCLPFRHECLFHSGLYGLGRDLLCGVRIDPQPAGGPQAREAQCGSFLEGSGTSLRADACQREHAGDYRARGEENEQERINTDISAVLAVIKRVAMANVNLTWVSAGYGWLVVVIPIIVAAPAYFSGGLTFGQLMVSVGAFNQVNTALRWYVANFGPIAEWRATLMRVTDFRQALTTHERRHQSEGHDQLRAQPARNADAGSCPDCC